MLCGVSAAPSGATHSWVDSQDCARLPAMAGSSMHSTYGSFARRCHLQSIQKEQWKRTWTSTGMWGTDWQQSKKSLAPAACAISAASCVGKMQPSIFETCTRATSFVFGVTFSAKSCKSISSLSVNRTCLRVAPVCWHTNCHGTRLAWCSATETTT
jgi:hypothetical protein